MLCYHRSVIAGTTKTVGRCNNITMKSILSEAEKKKIREEVTRKVTPEVTRKVTEEVTLKVAVSAVLNLMKKKNMEIEDIFETLEIPENLQEAVLEEVKRLS